MAQLCNACRFWDKGEEHFTYGFCHRLPPQPDFSFSVTPSKWGDGGSGTISRRADPIWPNTHESHWCGEWRGIPKKGDIGEWVDKALAAYDAMSPEEKAAHDQAQRESFVRGMTTPCEHGVLDFEQCPECRTKAAHDQAQTELSSARAINEALRNNGYTG